MNLNSPNEGSLQRSRGGLRHRLKSLVDQQLLDAAEACFAEHGLIAAKVEHVAKRAGVAVGTLYNHFGDRDGMLAALLKARLRALQDRLEAAIEERKGAPFKARVESFVDAFLQHLGEHRALYSVLTQAETLPRLSAITRAAGGAALQPMREVHQRAAELFREGQRSGALRTDATPEELASFLLGTVRGLTWRLLCEGQPAKAAELRDELLLRKATVIKLFWGGAGKGK